MNQRFTYSIPPHALSFPATASHICVAEPRPTSLNHPVQPLKGLRDPRAASVSYRALAPDGANQPFGIERKLFKTPIRYSSFFILHSSLSFTFSAKEKDSETGLSYFGSRYYSSDLSIWLSVDPMSDKYPSLSPYVYCADNPVKLVDPNGEEIGDYYSYNGKWLGSDGKNDNKAYVATGKNSDGTFSNAIELPISNSELLDRATWVCGESGGSQELITSRTQNAGDASFVSDAGVADYYAFAINNASKADGGFYKAVANRMGKMINGKYTKTSEGYFKGSGLGGNTNSKAFAKARAFGMNSINSDSRFTNSIAAVIKSVSSPIDPTGGCRAWLGSSSAEIYCNDAQRIYTYREKKAAMQFSFSSSNKAFHHTFYHF